MTSLFQIDEELVTTLHDLSDDELSSFAELHGDPADESQIQVFIFTCLQLFERTGSPEWAERAYVQAEGWAAVATDPDQNIRASRIMAFIFGKAEAHQHKLVDEDTSGKAMDLFNGVRYRQTNSLHDLNETIAYVDYIIKAMPPDRPQRPGLLVGYAKWLVERYNKTWRDGLRDLSEAIRLIEEVLNTAAPEHHGRARLLGLLSDWLGMRHDRTGNSGDLDQAIEASRLAISPLHADCALLPALWIGLGNRLCRRFQATANDRDLEEAIELLEKWIACMPPDHADRHVALNNLGPFLALKYERSKETGDLARAIHYSELAVKNLASDRSNEAPLLANLGNLLLNRYERTDNSVDLDRAIELTDLAMQKTGAGDSKKPQLIVNMSKCLGRRFQRNGDIEDLNHAARLAELVLDSTPTDHPERPSWLIQSAGWLLRRFEHAGALADLVWAMQAIQKALELAPPTDPKRSSWMCNLAACHANVFHRTKQRNELDRAIEMAYESLNSMSPDNSMRSRVLSNLASWLETRGKTNGDVGEIKEAISYRERAIAITPADHPERSTYLAGLATALAGRCKMYQDVHYLDRAICLQSEALQSTSPDHADRAERLSNLGSMLWQRFQLKEDAADRQRYFQCFQEGWECRNAAPSLRIKLARKLAITLKEDAKHEEAADILEEAVALLPTTSPRYLDDVDKQHVLQEFYGLASMAAAAALDARRDPSRALELLELGRGVAAGLLLDMRTNLSDLSQKHPDLAKQFEYLRDELDFNPYSQDIAEIEKRFYDEEWTQGGTMRRQYLHSKLNALIQEIREQPGYSAFLLPPTADEMMAAARAGPIVVINISHYRCDAILIQPHQITALQLHQMTLEEVEIRAEGLRAAAPFSFQPQRQLLSLLEWMWAVAARPILEELGIRNPPTGDNWPRIWWIPTGGFTHLPIHGAGVHGPDSRETVIDRAMSSYNLSVRALIHSRLSSSDRTTNAPSHSPSNNALVISMPETPNQSPLPFAAEEAAVVKSLCDLMNLTTINGLTRTDDVLKHLQTCKIFHFAGHGLSDPREPENSCLLLKDWETKRLTVNQLRKFRLQEAAPFLGYLSACSTGANKIHDLADEQVHLISACQLAGFRHVIGSLWEVSDQHCVDVARVVYETLRQEGISDESVCRGIHRATRMIRDGGRNQAGEGREYGDGEGQGCDRQGIGLPQIHLPAEKTDPEGEEKERDAVPSGTRRRKQNPNCSLFWVPYVHFGV
ncbi:hypothetical protein VTN00DRAFT_3797 [Thermoascus crustaceus]|uniref:uncharacterized protein n=1 Tax=Thermoascus crustaceus TaxID=5088 RepID=UPI0037439BBC